MRHDMYLHRVGRGTKERGDKTQTKEGGRAREIFILVGVLWPPMLLPGTEPRRWVVGSVVLEDYSPYKNLRSNFTFGLVEGFKSWIGGMLGSEKNSLSHLEGMLYPTVNFLCFSSRKLHSAAGTCKGGLPLP